MTVRAIIFILLLVGCSHMDAKVEGLPPLKVTEIESDFWTIQGKCWDDLPWHRKLLLQITEACTVIDLKKKTCDIYHFKDPNPETMKNERMHCDGWDHDGILQRIVDNWKRMQ